ncbi:MAG TPA: hypothetical protein VLK89_06995 [Solirubrobacterales bacterium]|nr:hypothetical protein [Solirubrobacterales bacterium]
MRRTFDKPQQRSRARASLLCLAAAALLACWTGASAGAAPLPTLLIHSAGEIVPIPASVPHEEGDMIDRRVVPDLRWIAAHFSIYVTDGYSGPLPNGEHAGCNNCHVRDSDHYNGVAVDLVPLNGTPGKCDASWAGITRLAHWAEPVQNRPRPPFRWVGYDGDAGHGCGNHLHLSWEHAPAPMFQLAEWVEVFPVAGEELVPQPRQKAARKGPPGGYSTAPTGGVSTGD